MHGKQYPGRFERLLLSREEITANGSRKSGRLIILTTVWKVPINLLPKDVLRVELICVEGALLCTKVRNLLYKKDMKGRGKSNRCHFFVWHYAPGKSATYTS